MSSTLRTADPALATYLKIEGYPIDRLEVVAEGPRPVAEFIISCPNGRAITSADALRADYDGGNARVDPRAFAIEYRNVRDQLFAFLEARRESRRS